MVMNKGYLSFDIEADGPSPLQNSMLSLGIVLLDEQGNEIDSMEVNIKERYGCLQDESTMEFWSKNQDAWAYCHQNVQSEQDAMQMVNNFYRKHMANYKLYWVAGPACFDWMFLKTYYETFGPNDKVDIGYACSCLSERRRAFKKHVGEDKLQSVLDEVDRMNLPHTHKALDDARRQGVVYIKLLNW